MDYQLTCDIIGAALRNQRLTFAQETAERWLREQPGHLSMSVHLAEALMAGGERLEARRVLRGALSVDPENASALTLAVHLYELDGQDELAWAAAAALRQVSPDTHVGREKLARIAGRTPALKEGGWTGEVAFLSHIPALMALEGAWRTGDRESAARLAQGLIADNPRLAKAHLILADCMMVAGDEAAAVAHIHEAVALDPGGEIAERIWDGQRPYQGAWPETVPGALGPLPHAVAAALGLNLLPPPLDEPSRPRETPRQATAVDVEGPRVAPAAPPPVTVADETLISIQAEINRLDGRGFPEPKQRAAKWVRLKPVYAILTSRTRLEAKYGPDGFEQIDGALRALAEAAEGRLELPAGLLYVDDQASLDSFQLQPVDPADPWAIKTLLNQLNRRLNEHEQELGWVLLVGGHDIIPHHRLPNPTDDGDNEVLSDNPYGCEDDNYFVPERTVGRLPDGAGEDPTLLLQAISAALAAHHADRRVQKPSLMRWWEQLLWWLRGRRMTSEASFGYSASVWRKASLTVFSKIGPTRRLRMSPPLTAAEFSGLALGPVRYGYFNLHGVETGPNWYGQRDPTFPADYPSFPVALRPEDVGTLGCVPEVVFSEACYGAVAEGRTPEDALCLKFLASGSKMFLGSTCVAYGGLNSTPEAADLLALFFWQEIMAGRSGGVAFQQAKVTFAEHLDRRQGYLDGEDQKTLISFVYYGDPTLVAPPAQHMVKALKRAKRTWRELASCPPTVCAKWVDRKGLEEVPPELVNQVRARVAGYLPGMEDADLVVAKQRTCQGSQCTHPCANCRTNAKSVRPRIAGERMVFTLHKSAEVAGDRHEQVVKVTVDDSGQMYKLTVSK
jgi:Flp pilus assembly protein TadD